MNGHRYREAEKLTRGISKNSRQAAALRGGLAPRKKEEVKIITHNEVMKNNELARLASYQTLFVDSLTAAARLVFAWAEQQPEAFTDRGRKDLRAIYGLHARTMLGWLNQLQHARGRTVVFVAVLERNVDDFNIATWQPQIEGGKTGRELPAIVDRNHHHELDRFRRSQARARVRVHQSQSLGLSGKRQIRPPRATRAARTLGALIEKLTRPGERKPFTAVSPEQSAQT